MGAGRTEVARAVFGADAIDSGEVRMRGEVLALKTPRDAVQAGIGYLSEDRKHFGLATGMDVESNITLPSLRRWLKWGVFLNQSAIHAIGQEMVDKLRIKTPSLTQVARLLSGGNQQKVVIAKWLVQDCEVLIFDEPTRGIDVGAKSEIYKLVNDLAAQGKAIIVISSELPEVLLLSHRILVMCEGRITGDVSALDATQESLMALATRREEQAVPFH
jgi:ribose transport system ATP-binding protein